LIPFETKEFKDEDWVMEKCQRIDQNILHESNNFVSFTKNLIMTLLGQEDDILTFLGYNQKKVQPGQEEPNDEDFEDDEEE